MKKMYKGAGVLFWRRTASGSAEVLLGLRSPAAGHAPGVWSSFGGGRNPGETPLQNALREAREETAEGLGWKVFSEDHFLVRGKADHRVLIPFVYDFSYHFIEVRRTPPGWPSLNWEHPRAAWFPVEALPEPIHGQTVQTIERLHRRLKAQ